MTFQNDGTMPLFWNNFQDSFRTTQIIITLLNIAKNLFQILAEISDLQLLQSPKLFEKWWRHIIVAINMMTNFWILTFKCVYTCVRIFVNYNCNCSCVTWFVCCLVPCACAPCFVCSLSVCCLFCVCCSDISLLWEVN